MNINIVVINDSCEPYLKGLFESLGCQDGFDFQDVIFVDNASADGSVDLARSYGVGVILSPQTKVSNRGILYNMGISEVQFDHVIVMHSDVYLSAEFLQKTRGYLDKNPETIVLNFNQAYVDRYVVGPDWVGFSSSGLFCRKRLYDNRLATPHMWCSEACFYFNNKLANVDFDVSYRYSLFEYDFLIKLGIPQPPLLEGAVFFHYFVEAHEIEEWFLGDCANFFRKNGDVMFQEVGLGAMRSAEIYGIDKFILRKKLATAFFGEGVDQFVLEYDLRSYRELLDFRLCFDFSVDCSIRIDCVKYRAADGRIYTYRKPIHKAKSIVAWIRQRRTKQTEFPLRFEGPVLGLYVIGKLLKNEVYTEVSGENIVFAVSARILAFIKRWVS